MQINVPSTIPFARQDVFRAYRDDLTSLVQYLPNISKIEIASREEPEDGIVKLENHWYAEAKIPKVGQAFIKQDMLKWIDYAHWNLNDWTCDWRIETFFMREAVSCSGKNYFKVQSDDSTGLTITGDLTLNMKAVPGVPRLLAGAVKPQLEKFIVALITPNFHTINEGIVSFLKSQG
jgi:hypothetical protein